MGLLAEAFRTRLERYLQAHDPTRALVGGLPDFLIEDIARNWTAPFQLFLVTAASTASFPSHVRVCRADDLTAERQGGWAALVSASEAGRIQESIRSSGASTVRELWPAGFPWRSCELPGVRWFDVRSEFIYRAGLRTHAQEAANCIDQYRDELRGEVDAGPRFFGALDSLPSTSNDYNGLCFQMGFPAHTAGAVLGRKKGDRNSVLALLDEFVSRFNEDVVDDVIEQFRDVAKTQYAADKSTLSLVDGALKHLGPRLDIFHRATLKIRFVHGEQHLKGTGRTGMPFRPLCWLTY